MQTVDDTVEITAVNLPILICTLKLLQESCIFLLPSLTLVSLTNLVFMTPEHVFLISILHLQASSCAIVSVAAPVYGPIIVSTILFQTPNLQTPAPALLFFLPRQPTHKQKITSLSNSGQAAHSRLQAAVSLNHHYSH